jgi:hypothetical protein
VFGRRGREATTQACEYLFVKDELKRAVGLTPLVLRDSERFFEIGRLVADGAQFGSA